MVPNFDGSTELALEPGGAVTIRTSTSTSTASLLRTSSTTSFSPNFDIFLDLYFDHPFDWTSHFSSPRFWTLISWISNLLLSLQELRLDFDRTSQPPLFWSSRFPRFFLFTHLLPRFTSARLDVLASVCTPTSPPHSMLGFLHNTASFTLDYKTRLLLYRIPQLESLTITAVCSLTCSLSPVSFAILSPSLAPVPLSSSRSQLNFSLPWLLSPRGRKESPTLLASCISPFWSPNLSS